MKREDSIADGPGLCYHCDHSIPVGSEVTTFGPVRLHRACVEGYLDSVAHNEIVRKTAGNMALSDMRLTKEDKERIRQLCEHPEKLDAILDELIQKHQVTYTHDEVEKMLNAYDLYETARRIDHAIALNMIREAESEEERNFWSYIADMNLQRAQKAAIEREKY